MVVVPSLSFPAAELGKLVAPEFYEERQLYTALYLRNPGLRVVFVTSMPVDPAIVEYHLRFLPDPDDARGRLHLVHLDDDSVRCLSQKLLDRPDVVEEVRALVGDVDQGYLLPFNVTAAEQALAEALDLPLFGPTPELARLGTKSGSREVAGAAGVRLLEGRENLFSLDDIVAAIPDIRLRRPEAQALVIKINEGTSGQGNAIVELDGLAEPLPASKTTFLAREESWPSFEAKIVAEGAVVEELLRHDRTESPSVQLQITAGEVEVISTHDQILGGFEDHQYLGCRFPAEPEYRGVIQREALKVGRVLADRGVIGVFGVDFLVIPAADGHHEVFLSEVNLRMGGTTHPFAMARLVTGGTYDPDTGELRVGDQPKSYVASDNLKSESLLGRTPGDLIETVDRAGLAYDGATKTGVTLHLLGALPRYGKMGATCIADSPEEADKLYEELRAKVV